MVMRLELNERIGLFAGAKHTFIFAVLKFSIISSYMWSGLISISVSQELSGVLLDT